MTGANARQRISNLRFQLMDIAKDLETCALDQTGYPADELRKAAEKARRAVDHATDALTQRLQEEK